MADKCCVTGFQWEGTPTGIESKLGKNDVYVSGSDSDAAILVIADLFGWTFVNERLLCDEYAKDAGAKVYMPDFFDGEVIHPDIVKDASRWGEFDYKGFITRNSKENRWPEIKNCAQELKKQYKRVGVIGYCFGGWSSFQLGSKEHEPRLVDCISAAHPTWLTKEEIDNIGVPVQICAPEIDPVFTPELKKYATEVIPTKGVPFDYQFFPGVQHAFATRGNPNDEKERLALVRGKKVQAQWMKEWLHGEYRW